MLENSRLIRKDLAWVFCRHTKDILKALDIHPAHFSKLAGISAASLCQIIELGRRPSGIEYRGLMHALREVIEKAMTYKTFSSGRIIQALRSYDVIQDVYDQGGLYESTDNSKIKIRRAPCISEDSISFGGDVTIPVFKTFDCDYDGDVTIPVFKTFDCDYDGEMIKEDLKHV